jgi:predicted nucleotidyltransferase
MNIQVRSLVYEAACRISQIEFKGRERTLMLVGSHAHGFANERSDLDLLAILDDADPALAVDQRYKGGVIDGICYEVGRLSVSEANALVGLFKREDYRTVSRIERGLMEKLFSAVPATGLAFYKQITGAVDGPAFHRRMSSYHRVLSGKLFDDVCGALSSNRCDMAVHVMRDLLLSELESALSALGDTYGKPKWLFDRMERCVKFPAELRAEVVRVLLFRDHAFVAGPDEWLAAANSLHRRIQRLLLARPGSSNGLVASKMGDGRHVEPTNLAWFLFPSEGRWFLTTPWRQAVIDPAAVQVLLSIDAGTSLAKLASSTGLPPDQLQRVIRALEIGGLLDTTTQLQVSA